MKKQTIQMICVKSGQNSIYISGYEYEVESCMKAIQEGKLECPEMPHAETIRIMKILDDIRKSWNYEIPWIE